MVQWLLRDLDRVLPDHRGPSADFGNLKGREWVRSHIEELIWNRSGIAYAP